MSALVAFARCLEDGCLWKPDPSRPMQRQAEAHTKNDGHATEAGWIRKGDMK